MATLQQQLAALRSARYSGLRTVRYGDREVSYKSDSEMAAAERDLVRAIATADGGRETRSYATFDRD